MTNVGNQLFSDMAAVLRGLCPAAARDDIAVLKTLAKAYACCGASEINCGEA